MPRCQSLQAKLRLKSLSPGLRHGKSWKKWEPAFGLVVKTPAQRPLSHTREPGFDTWLWLATLAPCYGRPWASR